MNSELAIIYVHGKPFHLPRTIVYQEPNGELTFECPHCGPRPVPLHLVEELRRYARKRS
jgi:hypothetical protein